jgi:hypothetical protein
MQIDAIIVLACEWIAFLCWAINFKKVKETRYKLFTIYLGIIAFAELLNYFFRNTGKGWTNWVNVHVIVFIQFVFFIWFLLYNKNENSKRIALLLITIFCTGFVIDMKDAGIHTILFSSLSFGIGSLLLLISIIIALYQMFNKPTTAEHDQTTKYCIIMGLIIFYIGAFPYQNFRNYFWGNAAYYKLAYFMHYLSQVFNCIMYLAFAYSVKWKIK